MTLSSDSLPVLILYRIKTGILLFLKIARATLLLLPILSVTGTALGSGDMIGTADGKLFVRASNAPLKSIVAGLHSDFDVEIKGLGVLENEQITFKFEGSSQEELVKRLLRHLNIKNYAFEFVEDKLKRVIVVLGATPHFTGLDDSDTESTKLEKTATVAVIKDILESSQAKTLGLLPGDVILTYDDTRIINAAQLVQEVKKKSGKSQIEMTVVRDKLPMRLILQGGFIGVRITTGRISEQEYLNYF